MFGSFGGNFASVYAGLAFIQLIKGQLYSTLT